MPKPKLRSKLRRLAGEEGNMSAFVNRAACVNRAQSVLGSGGLYIVSRTVVLTALVSSQAWVDARLDAAGRVQVWADSDSAVTRGLGAVLVAALSGLTPDQLLAVQVCSSAVPTIYMSLRCQVVFDLHKPGSYTWVHTCFWEMHCVVAECAER